MDIDVTLEYSTPIYKIGKDAYSMEIKGVHPQQVKWFENACEEFWKAQKWIQEVYGREVKRLIGEE